MIAQRSRLLLVVAALGIAAPEAAAATSIPGRADAGPVLAGDSVLWAEGSLIKRDGVVIASAPDPAPEEGLTGRSIQALAASSTRLVYVRADSAREDDAAGTQLTRSKFSPWVSAAGGAFANPLGCDSRWVGADVEGDTVVVGAEESGSLCSGIWVNGERFTTPDFLQQVRVAGPYVAWNDAGPGGNTGAIKVAKLGDPSRSILGRFRSYSAGWETFDIDAEGNIVAVRAGKLVTFSLKNKKRRVLSHKPSGYLATAGGRVAYISTDGKDRLRSLNVIDLKGKVLKRLERYSSRRQPSGGLALTEGRIAWSVGGNVLTEAF